jgi:hypothetical protein
MWKFWLEPVAQARAGGFSSADLREIMHIIQDNRDYLLQAWKKEPRKRANG